MKDIVKRLRDRTGKPAMICGGPIDKLDYEAADEIDRLRLEIATLRDALRRASDEPNIDKAMAIADRILTPNVEHDRRTAALSPGVRVDGPVGPHAEE